MSADVPDPQAVEAAQEVVQRDVGEMLERLGEDLEDMSGARVLLTGGAGFLGHGFVNLFAAWNRSRPDRAVDLTVADSFARGRPGWLSHLEGEEVGVRVLTHDVTSPLPTSVGRFEYVIHAASIASPTYYRQRPLETMDANVSGLRHLLERAVTQAEAGEPLRSFLFFSTSEIYGDPSPDMIPTPETYNGNVSCTGPRACYDESKRYGETLVVTFAHHLGVPVRTVRPFNNYGPGLPLRDGRVLPDFASNVLAGEDIVMYSDGAPTRTFCYVADAVVGYVLALTRGRPGEAYNIGNERPEVSIAELAERVVAVARDDFGYRGRVVRRVSGEADYLVDNPNRRRPNIAKARSELGYAPSVDLDDGLRRTLTWYRGLGVRSEARA